MNELGDIHKFIAEFKGGAEARGGGVLSLLEFSSVLVSALSPCITAFLYYKPQFWEIIYTHAICTDVIMTDSYIINF